MDDDSSKITRRYLEGLAHGREAASLLPDNAPFTDEQKAWLSGFLSGMFGRRDRAPPHVNPARATTRDATPPTPAVTERRAAVALPPSAYHEGNPYAARLLRVEPIPTVALAEHFELALDVEGSGLEFRAGDRVGIRRQTEPDKVRDVLRRLSARGQEPVPARQGTAPAWRVLLEEVDIERPTAAFVLLLARSARDREERATLDGDHGQPRPGLNVSAYLRRFPSARPDLVELVRSLQPIEPTVHAILRSARAAETALEIFVTANGVGHPENRGAPTSLFSDLAAGKVRRGDWLPAYIVDVPAMRVPSDPTTPAVFIGVGASAGATLQSLLEERAAGRENGRNWLFMADGPSRSFPFRAAFDAWQTSRVLTRYESLAGPTPLLVERLAAHREMLRRWFIDGAVFYLAVPAADVEPLTRTLVSICGESALETRNADGARLRVAAF
jgi:sulfite reductase (NADPH) flavoprotein alpha-component